MMDSLSERGGTAVGGSLGGTLQTTGCCLELGPKVMSSFGPEVLLGSTWFKLLQELVLRGLSSMAGMA